MEMKPGDPHQESKLPNKMALGPGSGLAIGIWSGNAQYQFGNSIGIGHRYHGWSDLE
jgi:hypothetical protein